MPPPRIPTETYALRRHRLARDVPGPILLAGVRERPRNLPHNLLPFRQDSTFLYFTGCDRPGAFLWLEAGHSTLYLEPVAADDALWHGPSPSFSELREALGVDDVRPVAEVEARARAARPRTLAVADLAVTLDLVSWTGAQLGFGREPGDPMLADAVIRMRRGKDEHEIAAVRAAAAITHEAHVAAMRATRAGVTERALAALVEATFLRHGAVPGYGTILSQRGEILHNHDHGGTCEDGRLVLLDAGAEVATGHTADVTRTWPVSGRFSPRQRAAYEAVLEAQTASIARAHPGVRWLDVHLASARVLARFLLDEGLLVGLSEDEAVERGAHALFFPHGVGHLIGLDVHDLNAFGDRATYPPERARSTQFGLSYLRLDLPLEAGWTVTVEPGFYVVPAILSDDRLRAPFAGHVADDVVARWLGFGGIRIEDDVLVTDHAPEVLTASVPKSVPEIEALVGAGGGA